MENTYLNRDMRKFESSQKTKADGSRLIPRKHTETLVLISVTIVVLASRRFLLIRLVVELTKEQRGCNSSLSRKQFDADKRARKNLMKDILNFNNRWLNSL